MLTFNTLLNRIFENGSTDLMFAEAYAEPGYTNPEKGILFADWNDQTTYRVDGRTFSTRYSAEQFVKTHQVADPAIVEHRDDTMRRIGDIAEKKGYAIEWSDEWAQCDTCSKAVRTSPDGYGWQRSYFENEDGLQCIACVREDADVYLDWLRGQSGRAESMNLDLTQYGYVKAEGDFENGWHYGQNDSPEVIAKDLRARGITSFIFKLDSVGQFDVRFSVWVHEDEQSLLLDAPIASALPYDQGTEMAKALRGEHSDVYTMTTKQISQDAIRACPNLSFDPNHYNEDGTACQCVKIKK